jgi:uncharacterized protein YbbC (DUF1343 family)
MTVKTGLEILLDDPSLIRGKRIGLVTNQSAVTRDLDHAVMRLNAARDWMLTTLFGPEHGIWGEAQDMDHVGHSTDPVTRLPVYSLYGASEEDLWPRREALKGLDALLVDLPDIGSRYYTFIYTTAFCMEVAADLGIQVIVLDRPNPIDGIHVEGNVGKERSFVGWYPLPVRHGMTIGELAQYFNHTFDLRCDLTVVPMLGWRRSMWFDETGLPWVIPSPNMPTLATATVYPGMCLVEGTNLSEGRGTTRPFEFFGAPWLNPFELAEALNALDLPGARFRPHYFMPTFQKHKKKVCGGAELYVTDRELFDAYRTGLWCVKVARDLNPKKFKWRSETYEFVSDRPAIDLLTGSAQYREIVDRGGNVDDLLTESREELAEFAARREEFLLYRE